MFPPSGFGVAVVAGRGLKICHGAPQGDSTRQIIARCRRRLTTVHLDKARTVVALACRDWSAKPTTSVSNFNQALWSKSGLHFKTYDECRVKSSILDRTAPI